MAGELLFTKNRQPADERETVITDVAESEIMKVEVERFLAATQRDANTRREMMLLDDILRANSPVLKFVCSKWSSSSKQKFVTINLLTFVWVLF